ncbi:DUF1302 domain-containing protein [Pseudothauera nasutitermitis]|uniref:DUF1302 domain-containing protein n=1 Tax=Pseudothauera nasutitermitis TaxID=2565930 RepID=A0A4S4AUK4_9RHOO|nr:DUF1302 domain-containing protein [Pseudothauera nasutitermitis]THF62911.1 DUF1302 domain-containing protein [Pseudothauera nasutitermitis]
MYRNPHQRAVPRPCLRPAVLGAAVALAVGGTAPAHAFEFSGADGELTGSFDTTLSIGGLWRMQDREKSLISIANGGTSRDPNSDDGNLRYKKGELVSLAVKATHDLELRYRNYGAFVRASYFYDDAIMGKSGLHSSARREAGRDAEILDAYVRGAFEIGGRSLNVRAGRQVVSWGESTFIQNGINVLNPINVTRLRVPGAELKEGLIPTGMLWASQELTDNLSLEAVWIAEWKETKIEPVGTFFSTNDFVATGGNIAYTGFGRRKDGNAAPAMFGLDPTAQLFAPRSKDREPSDGGEYGISLRWFVPELNNTEFGFYHVNYHSRTPYVSGYRGGISVHSTPISGCTVFDAPLASVAGLPTACAFAAGRAGSYFVDYPKNIKLFGLSFNTEGPAGIALQGEYSYRKNQPLQLPSADLLNAALGLGNQITTTNPIDAQAVPYGTEIKGYRRVKMHQVQFTGTKALPRVLGAEQMVMVGEVGYTYLDLPSNLKFAAPGCHLPQVGSEASSAFGSTSAGCFMTRNSWGYRLVGRLDYNNLIDGATVSPRLAFSHDVSGRSPTFNEGAKALTLGLGVNYRQNWQADIAYTSFFGGKKIKGTDPGAASPQFPAGQAATYASHTNPLVDRDFLSVSVSYSF